MLLLAGRVLSSDWLTGGSVSPTASPGGVSKARGDLSGLQNTQTGRPRTFLTGGSSAEKTEDKLGLSSAKLHSNSASYL